MVKLHDSPANTLCLCTGSLGSNPDNDIPSIIRHFGQMNRIGAMHVRNVGSDTNRHHICLCQSVLPFDSWTVARGSMRKGSFTLLEEIRRKNGLNLVL